METVVKVAWALLALIHAAPAMALFSPLMLERLYGIEPNGDLGVLMRHRGALFFAVVLLCVFAVFEPTGRRAAGLAVAVSVLGFLWVYARVGRPSGSLRAIAIADLVALAPLAVVLHDGWRGEM